MGTATGTSTGKSDIAFALLAALLLLALNAYAGFAQLANPAGDNDSLLQLVEVRDLMAGQGWFDLHQYRMGLEGGFVMHWSRLLDAPLALAILAGSTLTGSTALAEQIVQILWPTLQFFLAIFFIIRAARASAGPHAVLPAAVVGGAALYYIGIFSPGALDHHNVQLVLTLASLVLLLEAPTRRLAALVAGICATLTLAIGMESAPYAGALGAVVALLFLVKGDGERLIARDFGLGVAGVSALVFVTTVPVSSWGQAQCDTFSVVQFAVTGLAGAGLAVVASLRVANATAARRLISLGLLAAALALVVVLLFPQCLAAPYAHLDPRLQQMWLGYIEEAQSIVQLVSDDPARAVARFATPLVAIVLMALHFSHGGWRRQDSLVGALLVVAVLVSAWEVRGSTFSIAFAVIPLSAWIAKWRQRAEANPSSGSVLRMAAAWVISVNAIWSGAAQAASNAFETGTPAKDASIDAPCNSKASFAALGAMAPTTVLAISNLGSPILAFTGHRVFAGPYHRNVTGNLLVFDALLGSAADAKAIVQSHHVGLVALCRGNTESRLFAAKAPDGFLAGLMRGSVPDWLEPVAETRGAPLELYRVRPNG